MAYPPTTFKHDVIVDPKPVRPNLNITSYTFSLSPSLRTFHERSDMLQNKET